MLLIAYKFHIIGSFKVTKKILDSFHRILFIELDMLLITLLFQKLPISSSLMLQEMTKKFLL